PPCSVGSHGILYEGSLSGSGDWTVLDYPSSSNITVTGTVLYGPDALPPGNVRIVGSYTICEDEGTNVRNHGLLYEGPTDGSGTWQTIDYGGPLLPGEQVLNTIVHSTMGGLAVGNFDTNLLTGRAFVYDIAANSWKELIKPSVSITAYGIWYKGGTSYTIAGGYSDANPNGIDHGYLANWDSATQMASDWTKYDFADGHSQVEVSHFDGITTDNQGGFYLTGEWAGGEQLGGFFAHVRRMPHRAFGDAHWRDIEYPSSVVTTGNTVFENNVFGIYFVNLDSPFSGYIANVQGHRYLSKASTPTSGSVTPTVTESVSSCAPDEMLTAFIELQRAMHKFALDLICKTSHSLTSPRCHAFDHIEGVKTVLIDVR